VHAEKRIPAPDKELNAPAAAAANGKAGAATCEHPITPLRRVAAQHIGKLVRVRVSEALARCLQIRCLRRIHKALTPLAVQILLRKRSTFLMLLLHVGDIIAFAAHDSSVALLSCVAAAAAAARAW
jgi:hypothetical protein